MTFDLKKKFSLLLAIIATTGVLMTIIAFGLNNPDTPFASAFSTLKYFTIQSNVIVALYFFLSLSPKFEKSEKFKFWFGAVVIYITITFIVFVVMLQAIWHPTGLALAGNITNHYIAPLLTIAFLFAFRKDYSFTSNNLLSWVIYPIMYIMFLLIHGFISGDFIYPFFDINQLGIAIFLITYLIIMLIFLLLSFGIIYLTKEKSK